MVLRLMAKNVQSAVRKLFGSADVYLVGIVDGANVDNLLTNENIGKTYGNLTVLDIKPHKRNTMYLCRCSCGKTKLIRAYCVKNGLSKTCGQCIADLIGKTFNFLTIIKDCGRVKTRKYWLCQCVCGKQVKVLQTDLIRKIRISCGCKRNKLDKESQSWAGLGDIPKTKFSSIKHGAKARGLSFNITISDMWNIFLKQNNKCAISGSCISFSEGTASLDRIDSKIGYEINNIQWVHKDINRMKTNMTDEGFIEWCHIVSKHNLNKGLE